MSVAVSKQSDVVYESLMNDTQLTEPFLAIVHWAAQDAAAHTNASLLAVQLLKELYEVSLSGYTCMAIRFAIKSVLIMHTHIMYTYVYIGNINQFIIIHYVVTYRKC